jgi:predicted thioesterase
MIEIGRQVSRTLTVDLDRTIDFMGPDLRVYATPKMVSDVEMVCRDMLLSMIDAGQDSVGMRVVIDHLGPAMLGDQVKIEAAIQSVDGRKVLFDTSVTCGERKIGAMQHLRAIVSVADLKARLQKK